MLTKRRILEIYLNVVEWGDGVYGAEAAARYHFGVPAAALTPAQAARLAAMLPSPRSYRPGRDTVVSPAAHRDDPRAHEVRPHTLSGVIGDT